MVKFPNIKHGACPSWVCWMQYNATYWGIIPLWRCPIFVITHKEWEETSACQYFEERRKETTKGGAASHKGSPICSLQLFLFRESVERPILPQPESGGERWFLSHCWLEADVWQTMTLFLLCKNLLTESDCFSPLAGGLDMDMIGDRSFERKVCWRNDSFYSCTSCSLCLHCVNTHTEIISVREHWCVRICPCTLSMHVFGQVLETLWFWLCTNTKQFVHCVCLIPGILPPLFHLCLAAYAVQDWKPNESNGSTRRGSATRKLSPTDVLL